jgi:nucleoside-diphosphate-sugar epimerase
LTQLISNLIYGRDIELVNGGSQRRCFTYIDDGIEGLMRIIENKDNCAYQRIFNLGNPHNNYSIKDFSEMLMALASKHPEYADKAEKVKIIITDPDQYYGKGYLDVENRVPAIATAKQHLGWEPKVDMKDSLQMTLDFYAKDAVAAA